MNAPIVSPAPPPSPLITRDLTNHDIADRVDRAADVIEVFGLNPADFWPDNHYRVGAPCCTVGALGVASGYLTKRELERGFIGFSSYTADIPDRRHPVLTAVMDELGFEYVADVFAWSDTRTREVVVDWLRKAAADIRTRAAAA